MILHIIWDGDIPNAAIETRSGTKVLLRDLIDCKEVQCSGHTAPVDIRRDGKLAGDLVPHP